MLLESTSFGLDSGEGEVPEVEGWISLSGRPKMFPFRAQYWPCLNLGCLLLFPDRVFLLCHPQEVPGLWLRFSIRSKPALCIHVLNGKLRSSLGVQGAGCVYTLSSKQPEIPA